MDKRYQKLADILVNYSTKVKNGEKVMLHMIEVETLPLISAIYEEVIKAGGLPEVYFSSVYFTRSLLRFGNTKQIAYNTPIENFGIDEADVWIGIRAIRNPYELSDLESKKLNEYNRAVGLTTHKRVDGTRWVICRVPTESFAQQGEMSYEAATEFYFSSTLLDWKKAGEKWKKWMNVFQKADSVRIVGKETDLTFSTKGRVYVLADGKYNMPDGEFFTAPVETTVEGHIFYEFPSQKSGKVVKDVRLEFSKGQIVKATASANQDILIEAINTDKGSKFIGEFGVGTNYGINRFVLETLFDEKIGGTIHTAIGRAYKECKGTNESAVHWDLVKDLRSQGEIYLNGKKVFEKGKFLI